MAKDTINIHAYLAERREIAVVWAIEDVQEVRRDLSDGQAWEVLQHARKGHDAGIGINWDVLKCHAEMLFGYPAAVHGQIAPGLETSAADPAMPTQERASFGKAVAAQAERTPHQAAAKDKDMEL